MRPTAHHTRRRHNAISRIATCAANANCEALPPAGYIMSSKLLICTSSIQGNHWKLQKIPNFKGRRLMEIGVVVHKFLPRGRNSIPTIPSRTELLPADWNRSSKTQIYNPRKRNMKSEIKRILLMLSRLSASRSMLCSFIAQAPGVVLKIYECHYIASRACVEKHQTKRASRLNSTDLLSNDNDPWKIKFLLSLDMLFDFSNLLKEWN